MKQKKHSKSAEEQRENSIWLVLNDVLLGFSGVALAVLTNFISHDISKSSSATGPDVIPRLSLFLGGLLLLVMVIVSIASFMRRKNRGVILLKQRLAEIYLSALRNSALNPQLESLTSHD
jgi:hypothetical protein